MALSFVRLVGLSFQIKDDVLDLVSNKTGKPLFKDLQEGKITLPVIESEKFEEIIKLLPSDWRKAGELARKSEGPRRADRVAMSYISRAKNMADGLLKKQIVKSKIKEFLDLILLREK